MAKSLYHSELCKRSPIVVEVRGGVTPSQHKNNPPYVTLYLVDDREERYYNVENPGCGRKLDEWKGHRIEIEATGRSEDATIFVAQDLGRGSSSSSGGQQQTRQYEVKREGASYQKRQEAQPPRERDEARREPAREEARTTTVHEEAKPPKLTAAEKHELGMKELREAFVYAMKLTNLKIALMDQVDMEAQHAAKRGIFYTAEDYRTALNTLFIDVKNRTDISILPVKVEFKEPTYYHDYHHENRPVELKHSIPDHAPDPEPEPEPTPEPAQNVSREPDEMEIEEGDIPF